MSRKGRVVSTSARPNGVVVRNFEGCTVPRPLVKPVYPLFCPTTPPNPIIIGDLDKNDQVWYSMFFYQLPCHWRYCFRLFLLTSEATILVSRFVQHALVFDLTDIQPLRISIPTPCCYCLINCKLFLSLIRHTLRDPIRPIKRCVGSCQERLRGRMQISPLTVTPTGQEKCVTVSIVSL